METTAPPLLGQPVPPVDESTQDQQDYFGFVETDRFKFPDGITWIEVKKLNEGEKKNFQDKMSKDLVLERGGNARMRVLQGTERHELIRAAIKDWNLKRNGKEVPCTSTHVGDFLKLSNPVIVEDLEKVIRKANPWLLADMKSEDIEKEIENLQEMLEVAKKREAGEDS